jgi:haloalkane dehalogenase
MWSFMFRATIAALRAHFRCVVVDLPGLGLSRAPLYRGQAFARNADWLQCLVRALDLSRFTLAVHATAGPSALEMAVRERERVAGLVVTNSFLWPFADVPKFRTFVRILTSRPLAFANVRLDFLPRVAARFGRRTRPFTPDERAAIRGPFRDLERRRHLQNILLGLREEAAFFTAVRHRVRAIRDVPSLLLFGAHDNGYKLGFVDQWQRLFPRHEVVILAQSDHFAPEDQAEEYTAALADWWQRTITE